MGTFLLLVFAAILIAYFVRTNWKDFKEGRPTNWASRYRVNANSSLAKPYLYFKLLFGLFLVWIGYQMSGDIGSISWLLYGVALLNTVVVIYQIKNFDVIKNEQNKEGTVEEIARKAYERQKKNKNL
jgi:hypothetical protein